MSRVPPSTIMGGEPKTSFWRDVRDVFRAIPDMAKPGCPDPRRTVQDIYIPTAAGRVHYRREAGEKLFRIVDGD